MRPFVLGMRYSFSFIIYAFLLLRLIHTGYAPIFSLLLALLIGILTIYVLGALASNSINPQHWPKAEQKSAKALLGLLCVVTSLLCLCVCFFPLPKRGSLLLW